MPHHRKKPMIVAALAGFVLASCGDSGSVELTAADTALIDTIANAVTDDPELDGIDLDSRCMATSMVGAMGGTERAESAYGVTVEAIEADPSAYDVALEEDDAIEMADRFWECDGLQAVMRSGFESFGATADEAACMIDELPEDLLKERFAVGVMRPEDAVAVADEDGPAQIEAAFDEASSACGVELG